MYGDREWRGGNSKKVLYRVMPEEVSRCGHVPHKWKAGDLLIVEEHSGDCFYDYRIVRYRDGALRAVKKTAGYALSVGIPISERMYYLLLAGEKVPMSFSPYMNMVRRIQKEEDKVRARV